MTKKSVSLWSIPVRDLIHQPGQMRTVEKTFANPERLGEGVIVVPENQELHLNVRLESVHEGILATGEVVVEAIGECVRCLNTVRLSLAVNFQELFGYELADGLEYQVQDDHVSLEPVVRDAVVLALPFSPVCENGCESLELAEGIRVVLAEDEIDPEPDPRWAKLKQLLDEPTENDAEEHRR